MSREQPEDAEYYGWEAFERWADNLEYEIGEQFEDFEDLWKAWKAGYCAAVNGE